MHVNAQWNWYIISGKMCILSDCIIVPPKEQIQYVREEEVTAKRERESVRE